MSTTPHAPTQRTKQHEDGHVGEMTASYIFAERIMRLPSSAQRSEIAALVRLARGYQRPAGHPLYPTPTTRKRWEDATREADRANRRLMSDIEQHTTGGTP